MVFSSVFFLFVFLPVTLAGYYVLRGKGRNYWLLLVSLVFFSWAQPQYAFLITLSILLNYLSGLLVERLSLRGWSRYVLCLALLLNIGILFYYKYCNYSAP